MFFIRAFISFWRLFVLFFLEGCVGVFGVFFLLFVSVWVSFWVFGDFL